MENDVTKPYHLMTKAEKNRYNASKFGGRKTGSKNKGTIMQVVAKSKFDQKVLRLQNRLLNAQASKAIGQQFLYKIEKEFVSTGKDNKGYYKNLAPKLVEDEEEIFAYLEELAEKNGSLDNENDPATTYYFLTTKEPDNNAIDSLLNRVHGKAKEAIDVNVNVKFSLKELAERRKNLLLGKVTDVATKAIEEPKELDEVSSNDLQNRPSAL
jgi:hypothetical protein